MSGDSYNGVNHDSGKDGGNLIGRDQYVSALAQCLVDGESLRHVPGLVARVIETDAWHKRAVRQTKQNVEFSTFRQFVEAYPPEGLHTTVSNLVDICKQYDHDNVAVPLISQVDANTHVQSVNAETQLRFNILDYRAEDGGILDAWNDLHGENWRFVTGYECWYMWTGTHWERDDQRALQRQVQALLDAMNQAARAELARAKADNDANAVSMLKCYVGATKRSKARVASVIGMAEALRAIPADLLNSGNVLNLKNGLLDLATYEIRPHSPNDYQTYTLDYDYDPGALAPRFEQYLREVLINEESRDTDMELCALAAGLMGYSLTNETNHEVMSWLSGEGGNGKTVLITVIQWLLGPLCCSVDFQSIGLPGNYDIAEIQGKRVIFSTESERGGRMAEGYIKRIVSGERINARAIYGKPFEFKSTAKIWWAMNDKPIIKDTGNAIWRRLKLIPFNRTFGDADRDVNLLPTLKNELPGILNFALDGLRRLRDAGRLPESTAVTAAIHEYKHESNPVSQWLEEETTRIDGALTASTGTLQKTLYENYTVWCNRNGRQELNSTNFGKELKRLRVPNKRGNVGMVYALMLEMNNEIRV